ncbi:uncharacterized protein LOC122810708 [Protopterus annectens]|uniref:uncharacterized protein LOC122810708 n=1 Tax=Protopterus annectens TaxID=7888 RepID=UPI001CF99438|nr:uncharacterized protein LOC122810708 [Protopterus annectens]
MPCLYYNLLYSIMICSAAAVHSTSALVVQGVIGLPITLPCHYSIPTHGRTSMYWAKRQCAIVYVSSSYSFFTTDGNQVTSGSSAKYTMTGDIPNGDVSLTINELVKEDEGDYCCRVERTGWFNDLRTDVTLKVEKGGITHLLQLLDVSVNKSMKKAIHCKWNEWLSDSNHTYTAGGRMHQPTFSDLAKWVLVAWHDLDAHIIQQGFLKCCISNNLDGSEDEILWEDEQESSDEDGNVYYDGTNNSSINLTTLDDLLTSDIVENSLS